MKSDDELIRDYLLDPENVELPDSLFERAEEEDWIEWRIREAGEKVDAE